MGPFLRIKKNNFVSNKSSPANWLPFLAKDTGVTKKTMQQKHFMHDLCMIIPLARLVIMRNGSVQNTGVFSDWAGSMHEFICLLKRSSSFN